MAWYWPSTEDRSSAEAAVKPAVGVSSFIAAVSGLIAILSIIYQKPIFGFNGWSLVDALLFGVIAWRIRRMSRAWAVAGLLIYLFEVGFNITDRKPGALGVVTVVFILTYVGAIRGAFAYHRFGEAVAVTEPPASTGVS